MVKKTDYRRCGAIVLFAFVLIATPKQTNAHSCPYQATTAIAAGIAAILAVPYIAHFCHECYESIWWTNPYLLRWMSDELALIEERYHAFIDVHYDDEFSLAQSIRYFGREDNISFWGNYDTCSFAPFHNSLLLIHCDMQKIKEIISYCLKRDLFDKKQFQQSISILQILLRLTEYIRSSREYDAEKVELQKYKDRQKQLALDESRNNALWTQAIKPSVVINNNN